MTLDVHMKIPCPKFNIFAKQKNTSRVLNYNSKRG